MPNNCLFGKWYSQTTGFWLHSIPAIPWTIPVSIPECLDSTGMKNLAGLPAKFYSTGIHQNDQILADSCRNQGGTDKTSDIEMLSHKVFDAL